MRDTPFLSLFIFVLSYLVKMKSWFELGIRVGRADSEVLYVLLNMPIQFAREMRLQS